MADVGTPHGAAFTGRAVVGDAWRRCWLDASLPYLTTSNDLHQVLAPGAPPGSLVVLVDAALATGAIIETIRTAGSTALLLAPTAMSAPVRSALGAGVSALITLGDSLAAMRAAIPLLATGGSYVSPAAARLLLDEYRTGSRDRRDTRDVVLTGRERAVLKAMVEGLTIKGTARHLGISIKTVEAHRGRLFARLRVSSQSEAITRALTDGRLLVPVEGRRTV